jgi:hypothetical protein
MATDEEFSVALKMHKAGSFAKFILREQSEILRFAQNDSEGLSMTAVEILSAAGEARKRGRAAK